MATTSPSDKSQDCYAIEATKYSNPEKAKREARGESRGVILHQQQRAELKATHQRQEDLLKEIGTINTTDPSKAIKEGDMVVNESGGRQSFVAARMDLIPPLNQLLLGECLGFGANKYGENNWHNISQKENLNHAIVHILKWLAGDRSEPHLVNTLARVNFALYHAVNEGEQPPTYIHPDMLRPQNDQHRTETT